MACHPHSSSVCASSLLRCLSVMCRSSHLHQVTMRDLVVVDRGRKESRQVAWSLSTLVSKQQVCYKAGGVAYSSPSPSLSSLIAHESPRSYTWMIPDRASFAYSANHKSRMQGGACFQCALGTKLHLDELGRDSKVNPIERYDQKGSGLSSQS